MTAINALQLFLMYSEPGLDGLQPEDISSSFLCLQQQQDSNLNFQSEILVSASKICILCQTPKKSKIEQTNYQVKLNVKSHCV